jgi:hypothetical protein
LKKCHQKVGNDKAVVHSSKATGKVEEAKDLVAEDSEVAAAIEHKELDTELDAAGVLDTAEVVALEPELDVEAEFRRDLCAIWISFRFNFYYLFNLI